MIDNYFQAADFIKNKLILPAAIVEGGDASSAQFDPSMEVDSETIEADMQPEHIVHEVEEVRAFVWPEKIKVCFAFWSDN